MQPNEIRQSIREKRRQMDAAVRAAASQQICDTIADRADFQAAESIAVFLAFDGEPDLTKLISIAWAQGQRVFLPIVHGKDQPMSFARLDQDTNLVPNRFGIMEPDSLNANWIKPTELDCVLAPLVAFDAQCHRMGVGGGFYDRTFAFKKTADQNQSGDQDRPIMLGVAFELQQVKLIQPQSWDVPLDAVITEKQSYEGV